MTYPTSLASGNNLPLSYTPKPISPELTLNDLGLMGIDDINKQVSLALESANGVGGAGGFFNAGNSFMQNAGDVVGLAGGVLSLADMLNNWGMGKKMMKTNMANINQQMAQSQEAFDRSKARQDRSLAAVQDANERARKTQQGG